MFNCFEVHRPRLTGDWITYLVSFLDQEDYDRYVAGAQLDEDESKWRREIVLVPDGQVREKNTYVSRSEKAATCVARDALANPYSDVHHREPLVPSTPIFVVDEWTVAMSGRRMFVRAE